MNKQDAVKLARSETLTYEEVNEMLFSAVVDGYVDNTPSRVNPQFTRSDVWKFYATMKDKTGLVLSTKPNGKPNPDVIGVQNALRDFGKYLVTTAPPADNG